MKVLVTGHNGYIGSVMVRVLADAGHDVYGLDSYLFERCTFGAEQPDVHARRVDLRDVQASDLRGFDAVIHLAAISNDPLGNLNPQGTFDINHLASVRLAKVAREAGVQRFLFASSCSTYGLSGGDDLLTEDATFNPITPYGESKVLVERDVKSLATDTFSPVYLRNATAYGVSPRLRADIVVNNLVGHAFTTGEIRIESDGTPWRPLVHIEDISRAFLTVLEAPRELIHNQAFNVGQSTENYRISELAEMVLAVVPGSRVTYAKGGGPDPRCYRVDCSRIARVLPAFKPKWTVPDGVRELYEAYRQNGLTYDEFVGEGSRYLRIRHIQRLQRAGQLTDDLRWTATAGSGSSLAHAGVTS
ncbi:MAG TPA: NAD(P)-dependent oxidoreductase [Vicinamibacterales bacterium]|jgi:nucleoside-diphosphate-sugar epimerase